MHCGHLTARAKKPEAASRRALSTDQRQETPYVPSPAFVRRACARSATRPRTRLDRGSHSAAEHRQSRAVPSFFGLPQAPQAHRTLPIER